MRFAHLFGLCGVLCLLSEGHAEVGRPCTTPDNLSGTCQSIRECPTLLPLLRKKNKSIALMSYLKKCQCGKEYINNSPVVCCPEESIAHLFPDSKTLINSEICGVSNKERIFGGTETQVSEFPWMAMINYAKDGGEDFRCGGSLINNRYVLTAAHCIPPGLVPVEVRLGEHDTRTDPDCTQPDEDEDKTCAPYTQNVKIQTIIKHKKFSMKNNRIVNDVALLRLERSVVINEAVIPICLPDGENLNRNLDSMKLTVTGWGRTENSSWPISPVLLKVLVPVVPNTNCAEIKEYTQSISEKILCAGGTNLTQDSCNGDSGGPIQSQTRFGDVAKYVQFGIVSFGTKECGKAGYPGVYTRVSSYMNWILDNIEP